MRDSNLNLPGQGRVILVGAGCEYGQITWDALDAIRGADAIVYDDLMDQSLISLAGEDCELIPAGKRCGIHRKEQEEIVGLLLSLARKGKTVVRLKGGDPTVFGRGGEEFLAMERAGIRCEMIPGVSACIAAPEHMGISITQRGMASSFTVVTEHAAEETRENYETLAALKGTLIFLMSLGKAEAVAKGLIGAGKDPQTPVSILSRIFMPGERRLDGTLEELAEIAQKAQTPAILVIGKTASLHIGRRETDALRTDTAPKSALVVGTRSFTKKTASLLREDCVQVQEYPCIRLIPEPQEIPAEEELEQFDWMVFTSANGVRLFGEELRRRRADLRRLAHIRFACIGPGTAGELEKQLLVRADLIPGEYTTEGLSQALIRSVRPEQRVLLLRAAASNSMLPEALACEKIPFRDCPIYRAQYTDPGTELIADSFDYVLFGSAGGVRAFCENHEIPGRSVPVCIGRLTKNELETLTGRRAVLAKDSTSEGIRQTLLEL